MAKTLLLIVNPRAGRTRSTAPLFDAVAHFCEEGYLVSVRRTAHPGHAAEIVEAEGAAFDRIVCCGGDGTLNETVRGAMALPAPPPIGYIPGGSKPSDYLYATGELEDNRERYQVCLDTFYAVILHNQRLVSSPEDVQEGGNSVLYIGFYLPELKMADLTNCNALSYTQWTFQEKTA